MIIILMVISLLFSPLYAGKKSSQRSKKTRKGITAKKRSPKRNASRGVYYIVPFEENLRLTPGGKKIGTLMRGKSVTVTETRGNWSYVTVKAWIWRPSLLRSKPKHAGELIIGDVEGSFEKKRFLIRGRLNNLTEASFARVVLQGELFRGKKRVAYKTVTLFSRKKPLNAGKTFAFSIPFNRIKGFDRYSVRILTASEN